MASYELRDQSQRREEKALEPILWQCNKYVKQTTERRDPTIETEVCSVDWKAPIWPEETWLSRALAFLCLVYRFTDFKTNHSPSFSVHIDTAVWDGSYLNKLLYCEAAVSIQTVSQTVIVATSLALAIARKTKWNISFCINYSWHTVYTPPKIPK